MVKKTSRRAAIPPFRVLEMASLAIRKESAGESIYHLDMGQPGSGATASVLQAAHAALDADTIGYSESRGRLELRQRIAKHYDESYGLSVDADEIFITTGSSAAFLLSFLCAFDIGDCIAVGLPAYPAYLQLPRLLGLEVATMATVSEDNFQPTVALLEAAQDKRLSAGGRIDGLILASPSNPTGCMIAESELHAIIDFCKAHDIRLISDEIYHGVVYDDAVSPVSLLSLDSSAIIVNSFSKYFCMPGWRLGWAVVPEDLRRSFLTAAQNLYISAPTLSQSSALAAFDCKEDLHAKVEAYSVNRSFLLDELPRLGFRDIVVPGGGFYIYAGLPAGVEDSVDFCKRVLEDCGVSMVPGVDFDPERGMGRVRFSYVEDFDVVEAAIRRLQVYKQAGGF